jgi:Beta-galactosidase
MNRRNFIITASATLAELSMLRKADGASALRVENDFHAGMPLLLGTDYYPDQTAEQLWERDAVEMTAMGITNVRVAEFAWGLMEPREGRKLRLCVASSLRRSAAQPWPRCDPRDAVRSASAMANATVSRGVDGERARADAFAGYAALHLSDKQEIPPTVVGNRNRDGARLPGGTGCDRLADRQ